MHACAVCSFIFAKQGWNSGMLKAVEKRQANEWGCRSRDYVHPGQAETPPEKFLYLKTRKFTARRTSSKWTTKTPKLSNKKHPPSITWKNGRIKKIEMTPIGDRTLHCGIFDGRIYTGVPQRRRSETQTYVHIYVHLLPGDRLCQTYQYALTHQRVNSTLCHCAV